MSDLTTTDTGEAIETSTKIPAEAGGAETRAAATDADASETAEAASEKAPAAAAGEVSTEGAEADEVTEAALEATTPADETAEAAETKEAPGPQKAAKTEDAGEATAESEGAVEAAAKTQEPAEDVQEPAEEAPEQAAKADDAGETAEEAPERAAKADGTGETAEEAPEQTAKADGAGETAEEAPEQAAKADDAGETAEEAQEADEEAPEQAAKADNAGETAEEAPEQTAKADGAGEAAAAEPAGGLGGAVGAAVTVDQDSQPGETMTLLEKAQADKTPVQGQIIGWNKGGYHVAIGKIAAFCPVSQIESGSPRSPKRYLDKSFPFRVIEIQDGGRRVVVSRAAALEAAREARAALVREHLKPGSKVNGKVSSLTDFGAFVDLGGGIEGLVHVSELSRRRVDHPKEILKKGQEVDVCVLKIEKGGERISLSMKRLEADPWAGVAKRFPAGSEFTGKILRKADFGLFVEVEPGLEGLVHTSRLPLGKDLADESLEVGLEVSGWVHDVEAKRRRLSLSLRELGRDNPWREVAKRYPVGEVCKGRVERLASFGVFIELEPGLTGLLPFSVLSARAGNPRRMFHPGKEVSVRVLSIDRDKRRISLGTETSQAEGSQQDFKEYIKSQKSTRSPKSGLGSLAAAFAKARADQQQAS